MSASKTMKAAVIHTPGGPSQFKIEERPIPIASEGQVLIRVKATGLNRSEMFTRQGHSPNVKFPRILGIEAVGIVEDVPGSSSSTTHIKKGDKVATAMGGMGRDFDGGYAEYTVVPISQVQVVETNLPWETFGAIPEMVQTSYGSLFIALKLQKSDRLLIRGGTTSVGLAAAALAKDLGVKHVAATSRSKGREELLHSNGVDRVYVDDGDIAKQIDEEGGEKFDKCLELIGVTTLADSLKCVKQGGIVCQTGIVGNKWSFEEFNPMEIIPVGVCLTAYSGGVDEFMKIPLTEIAQKVEKGKLKISVGKVFTLDDMVAAHEAMDGNKAGGKIVVLT